MKDDVFSCQNRRLNIALSGPSRQGTSHNGCDNLLKRGLEIGFNRVGAAKVGVDNAWQEGESMSSNKHCL